MCATWNALSNFTYGEIAAAKITWGEAKELSDENLVKLIQTKLDQCTPRTNEEAQLKNDLKALLIGILAAFAYDSLKAIDWSSVLRGIMFLIEQNFGN